MASPIVVNIDRQTTFPTQEGFGTPALIASHSFWADRLRAFDVSTVLEELTDAAVPVSHPIYRAAVAVKALRRKPQKFVVGRRALPPTQTFTLEVLSFAAGTVYSWTVRDPAGLESTISRVSLGVSAAAEATAIAAAFEALADITASSALGVVTVGVTAGKTIEILDMPEIALIKLKETTADPGLATDLAAIGLALETGGEAVSFYGCSLDIGGEPSIKALALWCQANGKICFNRTSDGEIADPGVSNDLASDLVALAYDCNVTIFDQAATSSMIDVAALALHLSYPPGESTLAFKTLPGIAASKLTAGQTSALEAKNVTHYQRSQGVNFLFEGKSSSGEFIDLRIGADLIAARIKEAVYAKLFQEPKLPMEQSGIDVLRGIVQGVLDRFTSTPTRASILAAEVRDEAGNVIDSGPRVEPLSIADVPAADRAARRINPIRFSGRFSGAVHGVTFEGSISV